MLTHLSLPVHMMTTGVSVVLLLLHSPQRSATVRLRVSVVAVCLHPKHALTRVSPALVDARMYAPLHYNRRLSTCLIE